MRRFFWWLLDRLGWTFAGKVPSIPSAVIVIAPHTSNWDMPVLLLYRYALGIRVNYLAKHSLFWWPLGSLLRWTGAIAVNRERGSDVIEQIERQFRTGQQMYLALAPEGTRSLTATWKSGFYRIARGAGVPLVLVSMDYARRRVTMSEPVRASGDVAIDMAGIRQFYADVTPRYPDKFGPVRLAEEAHSDQE